MLEELHAAIANSRMALTDFWSDYIAEIGLSEIADLDAARSVFRHYETVLNQVLDLRAQARRIESILNTQPLKGLHEKEN